MSKTAPLGSQTRTNLVLVLLFLGTFVMGSAELVVVGVLKPIAGEMGVSISTAGTLVTSYALGLSLGGPLLTAFTIRFGRRLLLWLTLCTWLVGNVIAVIATNFEVFLVVRIVTGSLQGLFVGLAFTIGISTVPPERIGRAISSIIGGFAVSTALGVPIGTLIGQQVGWQGAFLAIIALGVAVLAGLIVVIPPVPNGGSGGVGAQVRHAFAPRVLAMLGLCILLFAGPYSTLTYITPFLEQVTGISGALISVFLLAYGAATAVGAFGGGRFADRNASRAIIVANLVLIIALAVLYAVGRVPILVVLALALWGVVGFGLVPSLQHRVVSLAGPGRDLATTLPASAINAGIAIGALIGGWALASHGPMAPVVTGVVISIIALPVAWLAGRLKPPGTVEDTNRTTAGPSISAPATV